MSKRKRTKQGKPDLNRNKRGPKKLKVTDQTHEGLVSPVTHKKARISNGQAGSENIQDSQMPIQSSFPAETAEHGEEQNSRGEWNSFQNDDVVNDEINARGEGRGDDSSQNVYTKMTESSSKKIHEMAKLDTNTRHGAKMYRVQAKATQRQQKCFQD